MKDIGSINLRSMITLITLRVLEIPTPVVRVESSLYQGYSHTFVRLYAAAVHPVELLGLSGLLRSLG